jgi:hypothetical protein
MWEKPGRPFSARRPTALPKPTRRMYSELSLSHNSHMNSLVATFRVVYIHTQINIIRGEKSVR